LNATPHCRDCKLNYEAAEDLVEEHGPFDPAGSPAEFYVTGSVEGYRGRVPYRGNLCADHVEVLMDEGAEYFKVRPLRRTT